MQVAGYCGAQYRKFSNIEDAKDFVNGREFSPRRASSNHEPQSFPAQASTRRSGFSESSYYGNSGAYATGHYSGPSAVVYTDGCCLSNGMSNAKAGIGVYWGPRDTRNVSQHLSGHPTNIRAELAAAQCALEQAHSYGIQNLTIKTDS